MNSPFSDRIRDTGYEALLYAAGGLAVTIHPTLKNAIAVEGWIHESMGRRQALRRLQDRGFLEQGHGRAGAVLRLTASGRRVLAGGREPGEAWGRSWDGAWRLLVFDLPRNAGRTRTQFWRWLRDNHFGRLQGSVWICPDPIPDIQQILRRADLEPTSVHVFTGGQTDTGRPRDLAAEAWHFPDLNSRYRLYADFAARTVKHIGKKAPSAARRNDLLREDRRLWWSAVRSDPLLPRDLHPPGYEGPRAWKQRQKLHQALARTLVKEPPR